MAAVTANEDLFLIANLSPLFTGLPFVVWISARGFAQHDIRVKVSRGMKVQKGDLISVALRPLREIGPSRLKTEELEQLHQWVDLNWDVLLAYWNGEIDTVQAIPRLKPLTPQKEEENKERDRVFKRQSSEGA